MIRQPGRILQIMKYAKSTTDDYEAIEVRNEPLSKRPAGRAALLTRPATKTTEIPATSRTTTKPMPDKDLRVLRRMCMDHCERCGARCPAGGRFCSTKCERDQQSGASDVRSSSSAIR